MGRWAASLVLLWGCGGDPEAVVGRVELPVVVCADGPTVPGIDVSHWQGAIDWDRVAADGIRFAFIRVSDGTYEDTRFDANWSGARRVGILRGVYQFFRPGQDPIVQADLLIRRMGVLAPDDLPPVADVEDTDDQSPAVIAANLRRWMDRVQEATGRVPIIYTGFYFWRDEVGSGAFAAHPLWIAQYGPVCPNIPDPWTRWAFHQTGSTGRVDGISGDVDTDLFNGDLTALRAFAGAVPVCGDGFCSPGEDHAGCPGDCPICEPIPPAGRIIDDGDVCFTALGPAEWWHPAAAGWDGGLLWTYCTDEAEEDNAGRWDFDFLEAGRYRLEAYTVAPHAVSRRAPYRVRHAGTEEEVPVDQAAVADGWNRVGEFDFAAGGDQWVRLRDNSGEPYADRVSIAVDAVRLTRVDPPPEDAGADGDGDASPDGEGEDGGSDAAADDGSADPGTDPGEGGDGEAGEGDDWTGWRESSGCGCRAASPSGDGWGWLLAAGAFAAARRRRRGRLPGDG